MEGLLRIIGILIVVIEIYQMLRRLWIRRMLAKRKNGKRTHKPQVMRPKSEKDYTYCVAGRRKSAEEKVGVQLAWSPG